uniref:Uncharacterized protein n=1 Tax=Musca domestica TaxID=7370 RepID=A0A1I8M362_MUSDO
MKFCIFISFLILQVACGSYPPNFPKCKHGDESCLLKGAADILQHHFAGLPDVSLLPIEPFPVKKLNVERNPSSPVNVDIKLKDVIVEGFKAVKIDKFQGLKEDMSGRNAIAGVIPSLTIKGKYTLDGNVLVLPIKGNGDCEIKCKNVKFDFSWDFKKVEKDGKIYAALEHVKLQFEPDHVHFFFDHLFDGDASLQTTTNDFLNANWSEIFHEIQPGLTKAISLVAKAYIAKFFEHQPYAEYFWQTKEKYLEVHYKQLEQQVERPKIRLTMKFCIFITFLILQIAYGGYPSNFPKCKYGDEPCLIKGAADILKNHINGVADVNLLPIDPFSLKTLNVARNPASPVNVDIKLKDVIVEGFKDIKLEKFQGLKEDLSGRNVIAGSLDSLTIKGKYMLDGNVLVLPIKGDGNCEIKCKNIKFDFSWDFKKVEKDGKIYAALEHVKLQFEPDNVHFFFDHLFDGDASLQTSTNDFLNANWSEIFHEIQPGLSKALGLVFKSYIGKFFAHQPYAEYFQ